MATKWVTKERPRLSGTACPWLIRRFVDPEAEIFYAAPDKVMSIAESEGAIQLLAEIMQRVTPEWPGLMAIGNGMRQFYDEQGQDDQSQLAALLPVFDALYAFCQRQVNEKKVSM